MRDLYPPFDSNEKSVGLAAAGLFVGVTLTGLLVFSASGDQRSPTDILAMAAFFAFYAIPISLIFAFIFGYILWMVADCLGRTGWIDAALFGALTGFLPFGIGAVMTAQPPEPSPELAAFVTIGFCAGLIARLCAAHVKRKEPKET